MFSCSYVLIPIYLQNNTYFAIQRKRLFFVSILNLDVFRISCFPVDTLVIKEFFCWVHGQKFKSATKLLELAGGKAQKRWKESNFTFLFGAVEQKPLSELGTEQMRQIFRIAKSIQSLGKAHSCALKMFHPGFHEFSDPFFSYWQEPICY